MLSSLLLALAIDASVTIGEPVVLGTIDQPVLALAALGQDRVLVLEEDRLALFRVRGTTAVPQGELATPPSHGPVRSPGGLLLAHGAEDSAWVTRSGWSEAMLVSVGPAPAPALGFQGRASALPWPGAPTGLRFRPGTNLIDGAVLGGPHLAVAADGSAAVDAAGQLQSASGDTEGWPSPVGSALVHPWPDVLIVSDAVATPPDHLLFLRTDGNPAADRISFDGLVRALASDTEGAQAALFAAIETPSGVRLERVLLLHASRP